MRRHPESIQKRNVLRAANEHDAGLEAPATQWRQVHLCRVLRRAERQAAVVFARDVSARMSDDPRVSAMAEELAQAEEVRQAELRFELAALRIAVRSEKLGDVANEFERIHN